MNLHKIMDLTQIQSTRSKFGSQRANPIDMEQIRESASKSNRQGANPSVSEQIRSTWSKSGSQRANPIAWSKFTQHKRFFETTLKKTPQKGALQKKIIAYNKKSSEKSELFFIIYSTFFSLFVGAFLFLSSSLIV